MKPFTFYGIGISVLDHRQVAPGIYDVTYWITLFFIPIVPLSSSRIRPLKSSAVNLGSIVGTKRYFDVLSRTPTPVERVLRTYALGILGVIVGVGPWIAAMSHSRGLGRKPNTFEVILLMPSAIWPLIILGVLDHRREKLYER